ncbi:Single-stranded DNA-binding protein A [Bacillus subtilis]|uniref:single-stranded DNA-binding protein n=1 Tax=Bacillus subtilis group TaxID=653685 RepID=UPI0011A0C2E8|nr:MULTISPECIES: single-stranded DNA-binding protein [Bacillus subtilis group]MEC2400525.1 single-stranded DNA-binding protein [Bacillus subtilis]MED4660885.1 single-stranded DNA-binding protein [Bacillus subtilis]MED4667796.1 single-stranded DNA-binding protein [Bacillus subtilis]WEZ26717.1 single-stranded DNA-binding protein [Bacillus subtilis]CAF1782949.1 Single-stranded DNA-binding protein A [Bacillus subtilis]
MLNRVVLVGRLTKDPELRYTPGGKAVATFTLAINRTYTNQQGEREADFIQCVVWKRIAENVANYLKKGSLAGIDGRLQTRNYENQQGQRVYVTEIICESVQFLDSKNSNNNANQSQQDQQYQQKKNENFRDPFQNEGQPIDISDDDLPF